MPAISDIATRGFVEVEVRAVDEDKREATFVAATEGGVRTWLGTEYLRVSGLRLARYRRNPVVLDTHDRGTVGAVIGRATVRVEGRELHATVTFAETERAETAWRLVKDGFVRGASVGFLPNRAKVLELAAGETDGTGEETITGPARVVKEGELYEISVVPVGADAKAVRRALAPAVAAPAAPLAQTREGRPGVDGYCAAELLRALALNEENVVMPSRFPPARRAELVKTARAICPTGFAYLVDELEARDLLEESAVRAAYAAGFQEREAQRIGAALTIDHRPVGGREDIVRAAIDAAEKAQEDLDRERGLDDGTIARRLSAR